jgi:hypothetical protein
MGLVPVRVRELVPVRVRELVRVWVRVLGLVPQPLALVPRLHSCPWLGLLNLQLLMG